MSRATQTKPIILRPCQKERQDLGQTHPLLEKAKPGDPPSGSRSTHLRTGTAFDLWESASCPEPEPPNAKVEGYWTGDCKTTAVSDGLGSLQGSTNSESEKHLGQLGYRQGGAINASN